MIDVEDTSGETIECTDYDDLLYGCGRILVVKVIAAVREVERDE